jgi:hypothetical protein
MLLRVRLDRETHVAREALGLLAQPAGVGGQLELEPLRLGASLALEVGRQLARFLADLLGRLLGGFERIGKLLDPP